MRKQSVDAGTQRRAGLRFEIDANTIELSSDRSTLAVRTPHVLRRNGRLVGGCGGRAVLLDRESGLGRVDVLGSAPPLLCLLEGEEDRGGGDVVGWCLPAEVGGVSFIRLDKAGIDEKYFGARLTAGEEPIRTCFPAGRRAASALTELLTRCARSHSTGTRRGSLEGDLVHMSCKAVWKLR